MVSPKGAINCSTLFQHNHCKRIGAKYCSTVIQKPASFVRKELYHVVFNFICLVGKRVFPMSLLSFGIFYLLLIL